MLTLDQVVKQLHSRLKRCTQRQLAEQLDISQSFLSMVLLGKKEPGPVMLQKLGLERVVRFRRIA